MGGGGCCWIEGSSVEVVGCDSGALTGNGSTCRDTNVHYALECWGLTQSGSASESLNLESPRFRTDLAFTGADKPCADLLVQDKEASIRDCTLF